MDLHLKNKNAFILASSAGIGFAIAKELASEGANVMLASRSEEKLKSAVKAIRDGASSKVDYVVMDQSNRQDIDSAVQATHEKIGKISILMNNSGGPPAGGFEKFSDGDFQKAYELTLLSYIRTIRAFLPDLKETRGRILNNTSSSIKQPVDNLLLSNVFRMGIRGLSKSLSQELARDGILVNTIGPGKVHTDRIDQLDQIRADQAGVPIEEIQSSNEANIPLHRYGKPEEFAKLASFLLSEANSYITGQEILVDGGMVKSY